MITSDNRNASHFGGNKETSTNRQSSSLANSRERIRVVEN